MPAVCRASPQPTRHIVRKYTLLMYLMMMAALLKGAPEATREDPQGLLCANKQLFIAEETVAGTEDHNGTAAIKVSFRETASDSVQQTEVLLGEHLPSTCGDHFSWCNMILLTNQSTSTSILLVPVQRGVAQIVYQRTNQTLQLTSTHNILELPSQVQDCQVTALFDLSEFADSPMGAFSSYGTSVPRVVGLCLNESGGGTTQLVKIAVDFRNVSKSSLSPFVNGVSIRLASPRVTSNFVFLLDIPHCFTDFFNSLTFYFKSSQVGLFDVASEDQVTAEEYTVYYEETDREFLCSNPRQLVRVSDNVLIIYCDNRSAQVDVCQFTRHAVENVRIHETEDGIPYYCSSDMTSFVTVRGKTVMYTYNSSFPLMNHTLPLMPDEDVYIGNCFQSRDSESESVRFAFTSTLGNTYLVHLGRLGRGIQEEKAIVLQQRAVNGLSFVPHTVYDDVIVYNNGSTTVLLNSTCLNTISIDHQHHLSLVVPGEGTHPCMCPSHALDPDLHPTEVVSTTEDEETENGPGAGVIAGVVVTVIVIATCIFLVVLTFLIKRCRDRSVYTLRNRQLDQPSHIPFHDSQAGNVVLSDKPSHPSIALSESPHKATSTSELTLQHDLPPSSKPDTTPVASLNLKGNTNNSSSGGGGYGGSDVVGDKEAGSTETHSYQVRNGKNDNTKSMVLAQPLQGSSTYKANGIEMHSEPLSNSDGNELTSPNSNGANHSETLEYYGIHLDQSVTPIEESR